MIVDSGSLLQLYQIRTLISGSLTDGRLFQRGNKNAAINYTAKRKLLSLKRQSKSSFFTEISSSPSADLKENPVTVSRTVKANRSMMASTSVLHPLNGSGSGTNGGSSNAINSLKKRRKAKLEKALQKKKIALKNKLIGSYAIDKNAWPSRGEPSNWNANKRKIEKKLSPNGIPSTSARPPNKIRKKTKLI